MYSVLGGNGEQWLTNSWKMIFIGHRRFLCPDHPHRKNKRAFGGTVEHRQALKIRTGEHVFKMVKIVRVVTWKGARQYKNLSWATCSYVEKNINILVAALLEVSYGPTHNRRHARGEECI